MGFQKYIQCKFVRPIPNYSWYLVVLKHLILMTTRLIDLFLKLFLNYTPSKMKINQSRKFDGNKNAVKLKREKPRVFQGSSF